ncbi:MAG TPA: class I SAM-dependent methyltransferase [Stellaceae bacterium]|nr:class I SAM-dependent methyltransferase [Stellaceae bacterium]
MTLMLTAADLARLVGSDAQAANALLERFAFPALSYRELTSAEIDAAAAQVDAALRAELRVSGQNDATVWERSWGEVAKELASKQITIEALRPPYFRGEPTCRMDGRYIRPLEASFEYDASLALRRLIFDRYLGGYDRVVEIGCGTGINLLILAAQFPTLKLVGCDWATPSRDIVNAMARQSGRAIKGCLFNMLTAEGWNGTDIDRRTAVLTVHALEQLASNWRPFLEFILARNPGFVLHIEPILELYDPASSFDDQARRYHLKRGYLQGYLPALRDLAQAGRIALDVTRRLRFGGLYHEAYSIVAWRPAG